MNVLQRIKNVEEKLNKMPVCKSNHLAHGGQETGMIYNVDLEGKPSGKYKLGDWEIEVTPLCNKNCVWFKIPDWAK